MKKYSKKWRIAAIVLLCLFLLSFVSLMFSGCSSQKEGRAKENEMWALIRLPDGNTIHTRIVDYNLGNSVVVIYTEDRMYITGPNNMCLIKDIG